MSAKSVFFVWHIIVSLAVPDGMQQANFYTTRPVNQANPLIVVTVGKNQENEAGYSMGVIEGFIVAGDDLKHVAHDVVPPPHPGWSMVLSQGDWDVVAPRTYTLIIDHALTKNTVTIEPYGFVDREHDGMFMPYKTYKSPYDVPGGPQRPEDQSEFYH